MLRDFKLESNVEKIIRVLMARVECVVFYRINVM